MSNFTFTTTGATPHAGADLPVALGADEAERVSGGESMFQALIDWRAQNWWLDQSMANHGLAWNGEVYVAEVMHFEKQGVEPPPPEPNRG